MNRDEAVAVFKEIIQLSESLGANAFNIKLSEKNDPVAEQYQIHITVSSDAEIKQTIMDVTKKHDLAVKEEMAK